MNVPGQNELHPPPLGLIEPHAAMLAQPTEDQRLFKVMSVENLIRSIEHSYLYFNRVDSYSDFPEADVHDGEQLVRDRPGNQQSRFERAPDFSAADYYDNSRGRTYASCFSLENSAHIWNAYGNGGSHGKVCLQARFGALGARINRTLASSSCRLVVGEAQCHQLFSVNYGEVEYVDWSQYQANTNRLPNPLTYTYLKDTRFSPEQEVRVSLSAFGLGEFVLRDGTKLKFPPSLQLGFDLKAALSDGTFDPMTLSPDYDRDFLRSNLERLGIQLSGGDSPSNPALKTDGAAPRRLTP